MQTEQILAAIDKQIAEWQQARELIAGTPAVEPAVKRRGRPKGSSNKTASSPMKTPKRGMSAEGKARIAAAQKARWAAQKKAAKSAARKRSPKPKAAKKTTAASA